MATNESAENYLETILMLSKKLPVVRSVDIANELGFKKSSVSIVPVTETTAEVYAKVFQALREDGHPIPQNDMWIAASAIEHGADIATADEHFSFVPLLPVVLL